MDEMFVTIQSQNSMAFYAGFEGERAVRTWRDRMKRLKDQGFIDYQAGPNGDITYVILLNPYHVIRRHKAMKHPGITETRYNTLIARAHDIGAEDMNEALPDDPLKRKPKPVQVFDLDDEMPF